VSRTKKPRDRPNLGWRSLVDSAIPLSEPAPDAIAQAKAAVPRLLGRDDLPRMLRRVFADAARAASELLRILDEDADLLTGDFGAEVVLRVHHQPWHVFEAKNELIAISAFRRDNLKSVAWVRWVDAAPPGSRSGEYHAEVDDMLLDGNEFALRQLLVRFALAARARAQTPLVRAAIVASDAAVSKLPDDWRDQLIAWATVSDASLYVDVVAEEGTLDDLRRAAKERQIGLVFALGDVGDCDAMASALGAEFRPLWATTFEELVAEFDAALNAVVDSVLLDRSSEDAQSAQKAVYLRKIGETKKRDTFEESGNCNHSASLQASRRLDRAPKKWRGAVYWGEQNGGLLLATLTVCTYSGCGLCVATYQDDG
jgi:hypothetical protein